MTLQALAPDNAVHPDPAPEETEQPAIAQVASIAIHGEIGAHVRAGGFKESLAIAEECKDLKVLVLDFDSPGGDSTTMKEMAYLLEEFKKRNPGIKVVAKVKNAYSAAFWLASICDHIHMHPEAGVGSIGVFQAHSRKPGDNVEIISSHASKTELDEGERVRAQAEVNALHTEFREHVYKHLSVRAVANGAAPWPSLRDLDAMNTRIAARKTEAHALAYRVAKIINGKSWISPALLRFKLVRNLITWRMKDVELNAMTGLVDELIKAGREAEARHKRRPYTVTPAELAKKFEQKVEFGMTRNHPHGFHHRLLYQTHTFDANEARAHGIGESVGYDEEFAGVLQKKFGITEPGMLSISGGDLNQIAIFISLAAKRAQKLVARTKAAYTPN